MTVEQVALLGGQWQEQEQVLPVVVPVAAAVEIPDLGGCDEVWEYDLVLEKENFGAKWAVE